MNRCFGFTLLELMIAILIFALISTAAYKLLDTVTKGQQVTDGLLDDLDDMQRAKMTLEKDFFQLVSRPVRNEFGDKEPALFGPSKNGFLFEFTRSGWKNPLLSTRSNLQRIAYAFEEGELVRYYWPVLDRAPDPLLIRQVVLSDVLDVRVKFMDEKRLWLSSWPPHKDVKIEGKGKKDLTDDKRYTNLPVALYIDLQHAVYGSLETVLPLVTYKVDDNIEKEGDDKTKNKTSKEDKRQESSDDWEDDD